MNDKIKCEIYLTEEATVQVTYGMYSSFREGIPHYKHSLCQKAANELWEKCKTLVNIGDMHWVNKPIETKD
jgi:hypothetical protein